MLANPVVPVAWSRGSATADAEKCSVCVAFKPLCSTACCGIVCIQVRCSGDTATELRVLHCTGPRPIPGRQKCVTPGTLGSGSASNGLEFDDTSVCARKRRAKVYCNHRRRRHHTPFVSRQTLRLTRAVCQLTNVTLAASFNFSHSVSASCRCGAVALPDHKANQVRRCWGGNAVLNHSPPVRQRDLPTRIGNHGQTQMMRGHFFMWTPEGPVPLCVVVVVGRGGCGGVAGREVQRARSCR